MPWRVRDVLIDSTAEMEDVVTLRAYLMEDYEYDLTQREESILNTIGTLDIRIDDFFNVRRLLLVQWIEKSE